MTSESSQDDAGIVLSLCMIVRDNAATLRPCLESIRPWVDEIVIVDTGSMDETPQIVEEFGGRLFHFPWIDDFSAARNKSLKHARGQWLFWMDSDDTITEENGRTLRELALGMHDANTLGYVMQVHCPAHESDFAEEATVVDHVKMFRSDRRIRFEGRIHEQVLMPIRRLNGDVQWTDVFVVHSGADGNPESRNRKYERDLRILKLDLDERPDHPFVLFNFGMTYNDMGRHDEAVRWLTRCITVSDPNESHVRKAYALLAGSMMQLGQVDQAAAHCLRALEIYPDDSELLFRQGMLFHELRQYDQAIAAYRKLLNGSDGRYFASVDRGISGYKARHNLAVAYQDAGRPELAEIQWREALEEAPHRRHAWQSLGDLLIRQQRITAADVVADELLGDETLRVEGMALKSRVAESSENLNEAQQWLERARTEFPEHEEPLQALCRLFFEHGETSKALQSLTELVKRSPDDPAAHHNLGQVYFQLNSYADAEQAFRESLRLRPNSGITRNGLERAIAAQKGSLNSDVRSNVRNDAHNLKMQSVNW